MRLLNFLFFFSVILAAAIVLAFSSIYIVDFFDIPIRYVLATVIVVAFFFLSVIYNAIASANGLLIKIHQELRRNKDSAQKNERDIKESLKSIQSALIQDNNRVNAYITNFISNSSAAIIDAIRSIKNK